MAQLAALSFQRLHLPGHSGRDPRPLAGVDPGLLHSLVSDMGRTADLCGNRHDRPPSRPMPPPVIEDKPHRTFTQFWGKPVAVVLMMLHPVQELKPQANPALFIERLPGARTATEISI